MPTINLASGGAETVTESASQIADALRNGSRSHDVAVQFTLQANGNPVYVNPDQVTSVH